MDNTLLAIFTGILALAILTQSVLFLLAFLNLKRLGREMLPRLQRLTEKTENTLEAVTHIADRLRPVAEKMTDSADIVHNRVVEIDGFLGEVVEKSRREVTGLQDALHDVTHRAQDAINILSDNILMPITRVNALTKAVKVAAGVFFRRG